MDLRLRSRSLGTTRIVDVAGEVDLHSAPQLRGELLRATESERPCLVLDLAGVTFMDSSGIGVIVGALKRARERGGTLVLVNPQPRVRRIFEITGLLEALPFFDGIDSAIAACAQVAGPPSVDVTAPADVTAPVDVPVPAEAAAEAPHHG